MDTIDYLNCTTKASIEKILRGTPMPEKLHFTLTYKRLGELPPNAGERHILFFQRHPQNRVTFIKMEKATEENTARITKLIAATTTKPAASQPAP